MKAGRFGLTALKKIFRSSREKTLPKIPTKSLIDPTIEKVNTESSLGKTSPDDGFLPETPDELLKWMNSLEEALTISLRDLSNSINTELLDSGFINNLMPISLLDAVIAGQLATKDSPSNLLKLEVPISSSDFEHGIDIICLLLKTSDLEFDHPSLRKCRSSLKESRNILLRMIKQQRHWKSRSLANEVSHQWLKNPPNIKTNNPNKS